MHRLENSWQVLAEKLRETNRKGVEVRQYLITTNVYKYYLCHKKCQIDTLRLVQVQSYQAAFGCVNTEIGI